MDIKTYTKSIIGLTPRLLKTAKLLLHNDEDAEDAVQDALVKIWEGRDEPVSNPQGLAFVVLRNTCLDKLRRAKPAEDIDSVDMADSPPGDTTAERIDKMMADMQTLPLVQQTILRMRHMEGSSFADIARALGITETAVRQSLSRARRYLIEKENM